MYKGTEYKMYRRLHESKLLESQFLVEQNVTPDDILDPLKDLITEEFIKKFIKNTYDKGKKIVSNVAKGIGNFFSKLYSGVVNFFKNFSLKKLINGLVGKIKEIGTAMWNKVKDALSGFRDFIIENNLADEKNRPIFKNIWKVICEKAKSVIDWKKEGIEADKIETVGSKVKLDTSGINESKYSISKEEIKYYGWFEKIAYALGIKNARFNGVVSQIMQKTTIGLVIAWAISAMGVTFAGLGALIGGSPVVLAAVGGMLLMAGLIILAIWVCKPYPTLDDCLAYIKMAMTGQAGNANLPNIINPWQPGGGGAGNQAARQPGAPPPAGGGAWQAAGANTRGVTIGGGGPLPSPTGGLSQGKLYALMIKNLRALKITITTIEIVGIKESFIDTFAMFEKSNTKTKKSVEILPDEKHLIQAFKKIEKSIKILTDKKEKGIGVDETFIEDILKVVPETQKESAEAKEYIMALYQDIYEYLYGKYSKTLSDLGALYKENINEISTKQKRQNVAEKIARFAKLSLKFEGEGLYGGLGRFGKSLQEFNESLNEIMDNLK